MQHATFPFPSRHGSFSREEPTAATRSRPVHALAFLTILATGGQLGAQEPLRPLHGVTEVREDSSLCRGCTIALVPFLTLREGGEEHGGVGRGSLVMDSRGRFFHSNGYVESVLLVFDRRGNFVRTMGGSGGGPGEFQSIFPPPVIGRGDTIHLFDQGSRSVTTYSPQLGLVREVPVGVAARDAVELTPGHFIINATINTSDRFGYPLHHFERSVLGSPFGGTEAITSDGRVSISWSMRRSLVRSSDSTFWAAHWNQYRIDLWRADGVLLRTLTRQPEWFKLAGVPRRGAEERMNALMMDIQVDEHGNIWTLTIVPAADWRENAVIGPGPAPDIPSIQSRTGVWADLWDTVVEVIDPQRATVIASTRLQPRLAQFSGPGLVSSYEEDPQGVGQILVYRLMLDSTLARR